MAGTPTEVPVPSKTNLPEMSLDFGCFFTGNYSRIFKAIEVLVFQLSSVSVFPQDNLLHPAVLARILNPDRNQLGRIKADDQPAFRQNGSRISAGTVNLRGT